MELKPEPLLQPNRANLTFTDGILLYTTALTKELKVWHGIIDIPAGHRITSEEIEIVAFDALPTMMMQMRIDGIATKKLIYLETTIWPMTEKKLNWSIRFDVDRVKRLALEEKRKPNAPLQPHFH